MPTAVERMLANNLADFEGLKMEGTVVINEELLNALIQDFLRQAATEQDDVETVSAKPIFSMQQLIQALRIDRINVHLTEGRMYIDLKIRR